MKMPIQHQPHRTELRALLVATSLALGGLAGPALAQPPVPAKPTPAEKAPSPADPVADPELSDESVEDALNDMRKRPAPGRPVGPTTRPPPVTVPPAAGQAADPLSGMTGSDFGVPSARRLREGTFLSRREGTMLRIATGDWIFVPRTTGAGGIDRPLVLVPSQTLQRLEEATALAGDRPSAVISGQVFSYRGREYLLPTMPSNASAGNAGPGPEPTSGAPGAPPGDTPAVQDLIRDLESKRSPTRALDPTPAAPTVPGGESPSAQRAQARPQGPPPLAEGSLITSRRGRLSRMAGGELAFAPDSDADSSADHPLVLLPCQTLGRMEDVTLWRGDSLVLEVSGRILTYQGRNYLLPTMFIVPAPSEIAPLQ